MSGFPIRTGDLVKIQSGIDEKGFPTVDLVGGILGRADDMVVVRGVNLYPSAVDSVITRFPEIKEYQVVFENRDSMLEAKIKIECEQNIISALENYFTGIVFPAYSREDRGIRYSAQTCDGLRRWIKSY